MAYQTPPRPGARMLAEIPAQVPPMLVASASNNRSWNFPTPPITPGSTVPPLIPVGYGTPARPGATAAPMGYATPGAAQAVYGTPGGPAAASAASTAAASHVAPAAASTALMGVGSLHPLASRMGIANPRGNLRRQKVPERVPRHADPEIMETKVLGVYNNRPGKSWVMGANGKRVHMRRASRKSRKASRNSRRSSRH